MAGKLSIRQEGISLLGKNDKGKGSQKLSLKRWNLEALKEERPKVSSLGHPKMESQQEAFEEETPKEQNNEEVTSH